MPGLGTRGRHTRSVARYKNPILIALAALGLFVIMQQPTQSALAVRGGVMTVLDGAGNLLQFAVQVGRGA